MKPGVPLLGRILALLALNIGCILVVLVWLLGGQFGAGSSWLLPTSARPKIDGMVRVLLDELSYSEQTRWTAILQTLGGAYRMQFALVEPEGVRLAGEEFEIPEKILTLLQQRAHRLNPPPHRPPEGGGRRPNPQNPPLRGPQGPPPGPGGPAGGPPHPLAMREPSGNALEAMATSSDNAHWLVVFIPSSPPPAFPAHPLVLLGRTTKLGESPLLLNPMPWILGALAVVAVSSLIWLPFVGSLNRALREMTAATERIADGRFDIALSEIRRDELGRLASAINRMSERLAGYVAGQKRFLGDAAHELCSPLSRIEVGLSIMESRGATPAALADVREEVALMQSLANELLGFSKAALGRPASLCKVEVASVIRDAMQMEKIPDSDVVFSLDEDLSVLADAHLLRRAVANLLRNARDHAAGSGPVFIESGGDGDRASITIRDRGPGVPEEDLPRIFDPFFRVDKSRTGATGGTGLGLAIVRTCAEVCGGIVRAANQSGGGLSVQLILERLGPVRK